MSEPDNTPRRRPPTIDLTAKEVETGAAGPAQDPIAADAAKDRATASAPEGPAARTSPSRVRPYVVGVIAGAVAVAVIIAGFWAAGLVPLRATTAQPATPAVKPGATDDISARLDKIEQALQVPRSDDSLTARMTADEAQQKALGDSLAALTRRVDEVAAAVAEAKAAAQTAVQHGDIDTLTNRIAALESAVKSLAAEVAARPSTVDDSGARATVAAEALRAAVESGVPYQAELAAVKSFGADQNATAALAPFAADGIPGAAALGRELIALIPAMERASESETGSGSLLGRLEARAKRLVRITPLDTAAAPVGDDASSTLLRINGDATRGDIAAALADIARLPAAARAPADGWVKKAQAREAAIAASRNIAADALAMLAKPDTQ
jgi:hypothetical protein